MDKRWIYGLLICAIAALLFYFSNYQLKGYLRSEVSLAKEVKTPLDSIDQYRIADEAPFKYRLLFPSFVKASYNLLFGPGDVQGFYQVFKFWSLVFYMTSALAMFFLLRSVSFSDNYSLAGALIFLFLPPMLVAFTLPVHTREDTLAYSIFFIGLMLLVQEKRWHFLLVCIPAVLTRETLLLLPLLYFFFSKDDLFIRRFFIAGVPGVLWLSVRLLLGHDEYDMWEGLKWNLANPEQVIGFLFITFNICWIPFLLHLLFFKKSIATASPGIGFFYRSSIFTLAVILITTFIGGIFNEIRLLYLFSPWMIILLLDFVRSNMDIFRAIFMKKTYWLYAAFSLIFCAVMLYFVSLYQDKIIVPGKWAVPYGQWIVLFVCYVFVMLLFMPVSFQVFRLRKSAK